MNEPIAFLVAERRNGMVLLMDDFAVRCDDKAEALATAARWRAAGADAAVFAVVPVEDEQ